MVLAEIVAKGLEVVIGNPQQTMLAALLLVLGLHVRSASDVLTNVRWVGWGLVLLALGIATGALNLSTGALAGGVDALVNVATAVVG